jgi:hypothetical protein
VESLREAWELILRMVGCPEVGEDSAQTLRLDVGSQTPHSVCGSVVFQLGLVVGMQAETVSNQEAQDARSGMPPRRPAAWSTGSSLPTPFSPA